MPSWKSFWKAGGAHRQKQKHTDETNSHRDDRRSIRQQRSAHTNQDSHATRCQRSRPPKSRDNGATTIPSVESVTSPTTRSVERSQRRPCLRESQPLQPSRSHTNVARAQTQGTDGKARSRVVTTKEVNAAHKQHDVPVMIPEMSTRPSGAHFMRTGRTHTYESRAGVPLRQTPSDLVAQYNGSRDIDPEDHPSLRPPKPPRPSIPNTTKQVPWKGRNHNDFRQDYNSVHHSPSFKRTSEAVGEPLERNAGASASAATECDSMRSSTDSTASTSCISASTTATTILPEPAIPFSLRFERLRQNLSWGFPRQRDEHSPVFFSDQKREISFIITSTVRGQIGNKVTCIRQVGSLVIFPRRTNGMAGCTFDSVNSG